MVKVNEFLILMLEEANYPITLTSKTRPAHLYYSNKATNMIRWSLTISIIIYHTKQTQSHKKLIMKPQKHIFIYLFRA